MLASGTSEAYSHLFRALCDPGDRVLVPAPGYPLLAPLAALDGVELASYPLVFDCRWRPDLAALLLLVTGGIAWEALQRLADPVEVAGQTVAWVALVGIVVNGSSALLFARHRHDVVD